MRKRVLSLFLAICMTPMLAPATAWASELGNIKDPPEMSTTKPVETVEPSDSEAKPEIESELEPEPEPASEPVAQADEPATNSGTCGPNLNWFLNSSGILTISGAGVMTNYGISYDISNTPWNSLSADIKVVVIMDGVLSIGNYAFYNCKNLTSVTIPCSVKTIGERAFHNCSGLTSVTIPESDSVNRIERSAFEGCSSLTNITFPDSLTTIGDYTFDGCASLTDITIPENITFIGAVAFRACSNLISVSIPNTVTSIGEENLMKTKNF